jgi:hypothetical protein
MVGMVLEQVLRISPCTLTRAPHEVIRDKRYAPGVRAHPFARSGLARHCCAEQLRKGALGEAMHGVISRDTIARLT